MDEVVFSGVTTNEGGRGWGLGRDRNPRKEITDGRHKKEEYLYRIRYGEYGSGKTVISVRRIR
jgi:hypothetical protein